MTDFIKQKAMELGFDACGVARAEALFDDAAFLKSWLEKGMNADMHYLERNFEKRIDPTVMVPGTKSVVVVLLNYYTDKQQPVDVPRIARYAHSVVDYHTVIKSMLSDLEQIIVDKYGSEVVNSGFQHRFVDSAPVLERRWAQRAGLGWIGKHTQLIAPHIGSFCFIGVLFLSVGLEYDEPVKNRCGSCTRCIDACPTNALNEVSLHAGKCISYQTIEKKSEVDAEIIPNLNNCVIGCDICADVCPWNKKWAKPHATKQLEPLPEIYSYGVDNWNSLRVEEFNSLFRNSAIKRAGYQKFKQNISLIRKKIH